MISNNKEKVVARGESSRNVNRTNSRNDAPLNNLMSKFDTENVQAIYQFCKNYHCRKIQVLIINSADHGTLPTDGTFALARQLEVPILVISHEKKDESLDKPITMHSWYNGELKNTREGTTWQECAIYLRSLQRWHEERPGAHWKCGKKRYEDRWLDKGFGRGRGELDLSVSNMLRVIPGVAQIDIDGSVFCQQCKQFLLVIEGSSDGLRGTHLESKEKATSMTRRIADKIGSKTLLLQHHVGDNNHAKNVSLTMWAPGKPVPHIKENANWDTAHAAISGTIGSHLSNCKPAPAR